MAQPIKRAQPANKPASKPVTSLVTAGTPQALRTLPERMVELAEQKHFIELVEQIYQVLMVKDIDYGIPIGTNGKPIFPKPMLYKSGAELLRLYLDLQVRETVDDSKCDYSIPVIRYRVTTDIYDKDGRFLGSGEGVCSSMETKYRYRWLYDNQVSADMKLGMTKTIKKTNKDTGETYDAQVIDVDKWIDRYGNGTAKMTSYGAMVRIDSPDIFDQENTILSQAKKRSFADGIKTVTGASRIFSIGQEVSQVIQKAKAEGVQIVDAEFSVEDIEEQTEKPSGLAEYQEQLKEAMGSMLPTELQSIMKANYDHENIAELTVEQRQSLLGLIKDKAKPQATAELAKPEQVSKGIKRDPSSVKTISELTQACFMDFNMQPKDLWAALGVPSPQHIVESPAACYKKILEMSTQ